MRTAIYPGSFDPITYGHLDIIERTAGIVDRLVVAILTNTSKKPFFPLEDRVRFVRECTRHLPNVEVMSFSGLQVDLARELHADMIIRGLRFVSDFEFEFQMASMNRSLAPDIQMLFMMTSTEYSFLSSSVVKEAGRLGGDISKLIPPEIHDEVSERLRK